jgi:hypothetical protein
MGVAKKFSVVRSQAWPSHSYVVGPKERTNGGYHRALVAINEVEQKGGRFQLFFGPHEVAKKVAEWKELWNPRS